MYEPPLAASARLVVVTESPAALTAIDSWTEAVCAGDPLSFTATVNVEVPLAPGVPDITPLLDNVSPAGRLPDAIDHV